MLMMGKDAVVTLLFPSGILQSFLGGFLFVWGFFAGEVSFVVVFFSF